MAHWAPATQPQAKASVPARIFTHNDGSETLPNGDPLHLHPLVKTRALNNTFALHDSCEIGDLLFVKAYFNQPTDNQPRNTLIDPSMINRRDLYSQTPFHLALLNGRYEIAKILVQNGADVTMTLEGIPTIQVLLTLIGSFPQYQIPMIQPTPQLLQEAVFKLNDIMSKQQTQGAGANKALGLLPTPTDLILDSRFVAFQSYGIRMLALLLDSLINTRDLFKRDDNGRTIFHIMAQYDLVEPFMLIADRLFYSAKLRNKVHFGHPAATPEDIAQLNLNRANFCNQLFSQDNLHRTIFHYCGQYRSTHILQKFYDFVQENIALCPSINYIPIEKMTHRSDLFQSLDCYRRTPLHYAYYYAAPFYSRSGSIPLSSILGKYTVSEPGSRSVVVRGSDIESVELIANRARLDKDPVVAKFLQLDQLLQGKIASVPAVQKVAQLFGSTTSLDMHNRTPYQSAVFNQPIMGACNAGSIHQGQLTEVQNKTADARMKPTLIGWSPRCFEHHTATKINRRDEPPPPENVRRLQVLLNFNDGILRSNEFNHRVSQTDILALNHLYYTTLIDQLAKSQQQLKAGSLVTPPALAPNEIQTLAQQFDVTTTTCSSSVLRHGDLSAVPSVALVNTATDQTIPTLLAAPVVPQNILHWNHRAPRATMSDILRCHEFGYVSRLMSVTEHVPEQEDWAATTSESIDVLHRDLHISVPNMTSLSLSEIKSSYSNAMDFYFKVLQSAQDFALLPPHEVPNSSNAMNNPTGVIDIIRKKRDAGLAPMSNLAQNIIYRERALLNLNLGFANLQLPPVYGTLHQTEQDLLATDNSPGSEHAVEVLNLRDNYLGDAHELYDSALFPAKATRSLERNLTTGAHNWRLKLTPSFYTNSLIQSSSLVSVLYHYPNYDAIREHIDPHTGLFIPNASSSNMEDDGVDFNIKLRERASTYSGELSTTNPASSITRQVPPAIPLRNLDDDTAVSAFSWFAALFAGGTVIDAVKRVVQGQYKNAFCAVRPPGHHSGPTGLVSTDENIGDSHGFCLLNNVAIGAAFAKSMYPDTIKRVAIIDFDVHHGNGTESIVERLQPRIVQKTIQLNNNPNFGTVDRICLSRQAYVPWHDAQDIDEVLFASVHGYHKTQGDQFYPGTGSTTEGLLEALLDQNKDPYRIIAQSVDMSEQEKLQLFSNTVTSRTQALDLLLKYTQTRDEEHAQGKPRRPYVSPILVDIFDGDEDAALDFVQNRRSLHSQSLRLQERLRSLYTNQPQTELDKNFVEGVLDRGTKTPAPLYPGDLPTDLPLHCALEMRKSRIVNAGLGKDTKAEWRKVMQHTVIPGIVAHKPDLIMISAGFDAHHRDKINGGHVAIDEDDYYWITKQLVKVSNLCCEGRIVSCLEGGYRIHCGLMSPFARSVAAHVRALHEGGNDSWTPEDVDVEMEMANNYNQLRVALTRIHEEEQNSDKSGHNNSNPSVLPGPKGTSTHQSDGTDTTMGDDQSAPATADDAPAEQLEGLDDSNIISPGGRSSRQRAPVDYESANRRLEAAKNAKKASLASKPSDVTGADDQIVTLSTSDQAVAME